MKVTQEKLPASQIGLEIEISPEKTKQTYEQVIKNFANTANIPGFRKGKVPRQYLLQVLGSTRVKATALEELIQEGIQQALKQEEIKAIGQPQLRSSFEDLISSYEPGKPLVFSASVDVNPEVHLNQYTGLQAKAEEIQYDPQRVEKVLENERQQMATLIPVEGRPAQIGDVAMVDFKGVLAKGEGEDESAQPQPFSGGEATDFQVELQEDKFIPGFVSGMIGMNLGETREITAQFPDAYGNDELAGKTAIFTVTLQDLKEKELPELNDEFAKEVSDHETLEQLRNSLAERFQKEAQQKTKANQHEALLAALNQQVEVDLPETMIQQEVDAMLTQTAMRLSQQGLDVKKFFTPDVIPQLRERSRGDAIDRLKRSLALQEVAKRESIQVSSGEIDARTEELMREYPDRDFDPDKLRSVVEDELLTEKILNWLLEHSTVELVPEGSLRDTDAQVQTSSEMTSSLTYTDAEVQAASETISAVEIVPEGATVPTDALVETAPETAEQ